MRWPPSDTYSSICAVAIYVFVVSNIMADKPFLNPLLLRDRTFVVGLILIFIFGMLTFTPITLLPTLLQNVQGYPDSIIDQILSARGTGTFAGFVSMLVFSRFDPRLTMAEGLGLVWIPLSVVTFATLPKPLLPDGTAIFHLLRNMGSSIFISLSVALVIRDTKRNYAELLPNISPFNKALQLPDVPELWRSTDTAAIATMNPEVVRQATMIGYLDAFILFAATAAIAIPLIALVRLKKEPEHGACGVMRRRSAFVAAYRSAFSHAFGNQTCLIARR